MKIAIMQPYFFPYIGYFILIKQTNRFILLDEVQFIRHGWIERNRIYKQNGEWLYFKVPLVKESSKSLIKEVKIDNSVTWKRSALDQLVAYKKIAPNYHKVIKLIKGIFENEYDDIVALNCEILERTCEYLNIKANIEIFSKMKIEIDIPKEPDEWALNICKSISEVNEYWNPPSGKSLFDIAKYHKANINLKFIQPNLIVYDQKREPFMPGLSIIDVMMFNSDEQIDFMLNNYSFI